MTKENKDRLKVEETTEEYRTSSEEDRSSWKQMGKRIQEIRGKTSRPDFAAQIPTHPGTLRRYEIGERPPPADFLLALNIGWNIEPYWVLTGDGPKIKTTLKGFDLELFLECLSILDDELSAQNIDMTADLRATYAAGAFGDALEHSDDREQQLSLIRVALKTVAKLYAERL